MILVKQNTNEIKCYECVVLLRGFHQEFKIYLLNSEKDEKKDVVKIALLLNCSGRELLNIFNTLPVAKADK